MKRIYTVLLFFCFVSIVFAALPAPDEFMQLVSQGKSYMPVESYSGDGNEKLQSVISAFNNRGYFRNYRVYIMDSPEWNAFASAGNASPDVLCILTGLLNDVQSPDELAAVVGHELIHNTAQHGAKQRSAATTAILMGTVVGGGNDAQTAQIFASMMAMGFSRDQEAEADRDGLFMMVDAGFDPSSAVALWERVARRYGSGGAKVFMDHPPNDARAKELRRLMTKHMRQDENGRWMVVSRPAKDSFFTMDKRWRNGFGAALVGGGAYVLSEADKVGYNFSSLDRNKMWEEGAKWAGAGFAFGFLFPSDFVFGFHQSRGNIQPIVLPGQISTTYGLAMQIRW